MNRLEIMSLAFQGEQRDSFNGTFIEVLHSYKINHEAKDVEFLAFFACATMTCNDQQDKDRVEDFLKTVQKRTESVWEYIDLEMYMLDYAFETETLQLLMLMHEIIMTTQTIERSVQLSVRYNQDLTSFFVNIFKNAGIEGVFPDSPYDPQKKIWTFLRLMVRKNGADLGLWGSWIKAIDLQIPLDAKLAQAAVDMGIYDLNAPTAKSREDITDYFRVLFPLDPAKGYFALRSYSMMRE